METHKAGSTALRPSCRACFELPDSAYFGRGALCLVDSGVGTRKCLNVNPRSWFRTFWNADGFLYAKSPRHLLMSRTSYKKVAATYSPTWWGSTIGDGELNFSVRNGKRWILTAITATVCFWEKTTSEVIVCSNNFLSASIYVSLSFRLFLIDLTSVPCLKAVGTQGNPTQRKMSGY